MYIVHEQLLLSALLEENDFEDYSNLFAKNPLFFMKNFIKDKSGIPSKRRIRAGGRSKNKALRERDIFKQSPWCLPVNQDPPIEPLLEDGVQAIHNSAMKILEEIGIEFLNEEAQELFKQAGCKVVGNNVKMDSHWVMEMVGKAPSKFTITPRNQDRKIVIGGKNILFVNVSSPPNYYDIEIGKKITGTREHCKNILKLSKYFNCIHMIGGYPV